MKNNNKAVIRKLSNRSMKHNQMRNLFALISIVLTALLFTTLFSFVSGMIQITEEQTMRQIGTSAHGGFKNVTEQEYNKLIKNPMVKDSGYDIFLAFAENKELLKRQTEIRYTQLHNMKFGFCKLEKGSMPDAENEIVMDNITLNMLGLPCQVGQKVPIQFHFLGKAYNKTFTLSGWYKGDPVIGASSVFISEQFLKEVKQGYTDEEIQQKEKQNPGYGEVGLYQVNVMFRNSVDIEQHMKQVAKESGIVLESSQIGVNWAYLSSNMGQMDLTSVVLVAVVFVVILLTGYLIIFNIFQISILKDISFYGLLKTIGTTKRQIKSLIRRQALYLSIIGIPVGLLSGFFLGKGFMPFILKLTDGISTNGFQMKPNPYIFVFSAGFSLITVFISCYKPGKIAANVTPIEALRYSEETGSKKRGKMKKTINGARLTKMALSNLTRNKKKTAVVIVSLSLSIVLLTEIVTFTKSFSLNAYLEGMLTGDFLIFQTSLIHTTNNPSVKLSEKFYEEALSQEGVEQASCFYSDQRMYHKLSKVGYGQFKKFYKEDRLDIRDFNQEDMEKVLSTNEPIQEQRYAYDEGVLNKLKVLEGTFDLQKFRTGNYILVTPVTEDEKGTYYRPGDKVTLDFSGSEPKYKEIKDKEGRLIDQKIIADQHKVYEVMAVVDLPSSMTERRYALNGLTTIMPKDEFLKMDGLAEKFAASFQVADDKEAKFQTFLKKYTSQMEPDTDFESKENVRAEFESFTKVFTMIGGALSLVVAIVGILNFVNTMLTSVIIRKKEFAMLQSIGMTNDQLKKMLLFEGFYYVGFTALISIVVGSTLSLSAVRAFNQSAAYFEYRFTLMPFVETIPVFLLIAYGVSHLSYRHVRKQSIVERLREE